jgi:uncharacterized membrane protein YraQ (UPF0718 family)
MNKLLKTIKKSVECDFWYIFTLIIAVFIYVAFTWKSNGAQILSSFLIAVFTALLWKVTKKQAEISQKQTEIQNAQFEPDVDIYGFSKSEICSNRLDFRTYIKNNSYSSLKIRGIKCKSNSFNFFIDYSDANMFPNRKEQEIEELVFSNRLLIQKDGYDTSKFNIEGIETTEDITLEFKEAIKKLKNEIVILKLCYCPRRAKAKDQFIHFKFKIGDVLEYPDGSTVEIY